MRIDVVADPDRVVPDPLRDNNVLSWRGACAPVRRPIAEPTARASRPRRGVAPMPRTIIQAVELAAPPAVLYAQYLNAKTHAAITGAHVGIVR